MLTEEYTMKDNAVLTVIGELIAPDEYIIYRVTGGAVRRTTLTEIAELAAKRHGVLKVSYRGI